MSRTVHCKKCGKELQTDNYSANMDYYCDRCYAEKNRVTVAGMTGHSDGSVTTTYSNGTQITRSAKQVNRGFWGAIIFILVIVVGGFLGIRYLNYSSAENSIQYNFEIKTSLQDGGADFLNSILSKDDSCAYWNVIIENRPSEYWDTVFHFSKEAIVSYHVKDGVPVYVYYFDDYDAGTGLHGIYYMTTINGKACVIDKEKETIYPEGTAFYNENKEKLSAFAYDTLVPAAIGDFADGEYGERSEYSYGYKVLKKGSSAVSAKISNSDNEYVYLLDGDGKDRMFYHFTFCKEDHKTFPDFSTYKTAEK